MICQKSHFSICLIAYTRKHIWCFSPEAQPEHRNSFVLKGLRYAYTAAPLTPCFCGTLTAWIIQAYSYIMSWIIPNFAKYDNTEQSMRYDGGDVKTRQRKPWIFMSFIPLKRSMETQYHLYSMAPIRREIEKRASHTLLKYPPLLPWPWSYEKAMPMCSEIRVLHEDSSSPATQRQHRFLLLLMDLPATTSQWIQSGFPYSANSTASQQGMVLHSR